MRATVAFVTSTEFEYETIPPPIAVTEPATAPHVPWMRLLAIVEMVIALSYGPRTSKPAPAPMAEFAPCADTCATLRLTVDAVIRIFELICNPTASTTAPDDEDSAVPVFSSIVDREIALVLPLS